MRLATVDSIKDLAISATLSLQARGTPMIGNYVLIKHAGELVLGRVGSVELTNIIHQNETFAPYIMQHGSIKDWSGDVDIERAEVEVVRVVNDQGKLDTMRRNPPSGTDIESVNAADFKQFYNDKKYYLVVGEIPNTGGIDATVVNRSFGPHSDSNGVDLGGYGEARHTAIYGQTGSAKTVLATTLIAGKLMAHPSMGLLIPDTGGDISSPGSHNRGAYKWSWLEVLDNIQIAYDLIKISEIKLTAHRTLAAKLTDILREPLAAKSDKTDPIARAVVDDLFPNNGKILHTDLTVAKIITLLPGAVSQAYATASTRNDKLSRVAQMGTPGSGVAARFAADLARVSKLFDGRYEIGPLVRDVVSNSRKVIIQELSDENEDDQELVLREIMSALRLEATKAFRANQGKRACNALVVLDEGNRWIPEGSSNDQDEIGGIIRRNLVDTRKFGIGWMIIAQSMSSVSKELLRSAHTAYFGRGLGIGVDAQHLRDKLGEGGLALYRQLDLQGGYYWVGTGLDNNVGSDSSYFSFHPFGGDATQAFFDANTHLWDYDEPADAAEEDIFG
jgi:hypothetical protein